MKNAIEVHQLRKSYGAVEAVKGTDFYVEKGQLFSLLGENGAGKSTTIDILSTLLAPDSGRAEIAGYTLGRQNAEIRRHIGVVFQHNFLDDNLTVRENLMTRGRLYGLSAPSIKARIAELAQPLGIEEFLGRRYKALSGGQRRRADIARALLAEPEVLFLDEPTTGLDPASRAAIWQMVRTLQRETGMTVLLTTHYMEEAAVADYVIVMGHGEILAKGTPAAIKTAYTADRLLLDTRNTKKTGALLARAGHAYTEVGGRLEVPLADTWQALDLIEKLRPQLASFEVVQGSMDDAFLRIIESQNTEEKSA